MKETILLHNRPIQFEGNSVDATLFVAIKRCKPGDDIWSVRDEWGWRWRWHAMRWGWTATAGPRGLIRRVELPRIGPQQVRREEWPWLCWIPPLQWCHRSWVAMWPHIILFDRTGHHFHIPLPLYLWYVRKVRLKRKKKTYNDSSPRVDVAMSQPVANASNWIITIYWGVESFCVHFTFPAFLELNNNFLDAVISYLQPTLNCWRFVFHVGSCCTLRKKWC